MSWLRQLDSLLRGERTRDDLLAGGRFDLPLNVFVPLAVVLGGVYGFFMGWFSISSGRESGVMQMAASTVKLPALFLLTLVVTFPSLYVFNALVGTRLRFLACLRLLVAAIVVNLAVGASLGPILAFFTLSTNSHAFMVILNVVLLGIAGVVGLGFLLRTLQRLTAGPAVVIEPIPPMAPIAPDPDDPDAAGPSGAPAAPGEPASAAGGVFYVWVIIYGLVGAQMGWLLRPFIGHPGLPFEWFRVKEGNVFIGIAAALKRLLEP